MLGLHLSEWSVVERVDALSRAFRRGVHQAGPGVHRLRLGVFRDRPMADGRTATDHVTGEKYAIDQAQGWPSESAAAIWPDADQVKPCSLRARRDGTSDGMNAKLLSSWRDGPARQAIVEFVERISGADGSAATAVEKRVAVFDNDGTLWCEKPMPIQLDFVLRRLVEMAEAQPELRERQPWKAAYDRDYGWLSALMTEHYAGNDTNVRALAAGVLAAFAGISVEDFEEQSNAFLRSAPHPTLGRGYLQCVTYRWSSCSATWRRTGSRITSPRVAVATSCGRSARTCTAFHASG